MAHTPGDKLLMRTAHDLLAAARAVCAAFLNAPTDEIRLTEEMWERLDELEAVVNRIEEGDIPPQARADLVARWTAEG